MTDSAQASLKEWHSLLQALIPVADKVSTQEWKSASEFAATMTRCCETLEKDLQNIENKDFIFSESQAADAATDEIVEYIRQWHVMGNAPSLVAMIIASALKFEIKDPDQIQPLLMAGLLGDIENDLPYHNNLHFKKVVLQLIRLISVHNGIYGATARELDKAQITTLLIGGCIHDLGHDGLGNTVKGVFYPARLERRSFDLAKPYLDLCGFSDGHLQNLKVMLLTTDVSPLGDLTNPMNQMKAAYRFHFLGEKEQYYTLNLSGELAAMEESEQLTTMACLLHEADIATSAGLNYSITQYETCKVMEELGASQAKPSHIIDFFEKVCQRQFLSDAGQKLFSANLARIYALAEEGERNGNEASPKADHTDFIIGAGKVGDGDCEDDTSAKTNTIN